MKSIILLDASNAEPNWWPIVQDSRLIEKLVAIGIPLVGIDPNGFLMGTEICRNGSLSEAIRCAEERYSARALVHISLDQVFVDPQLIKSAIETFASASPDVFTQWEHCRLPVGVGVRVFSPPVLDGVESIDAALIRLIARPEEYTWRYDERDYCGRLQSLLDSRIGPVLQQKLTLRKPPDWTLGGFIGLANDSADLFYVPERPAARVDERGMPAPYGFESPGCADFPGYVMFDLTNRCNAACIHCPQSVGFEGKGRSLFLDPDIFRRVIDECVGRHIDFVRITADGEPTLHPQLWDMLDYAVAKGVGPVGLTTNGSALNERNSERLLDTGIFMVDISLDAFSAATFEKVRVGLSYERTVGNIHRLLELRHRRGSDLKVMVSFVKQDQNAGELDAFVRHWEPLVDRVLVREMISNVGINSLGDERNEMRRWPCPHLWRRVVVNYDGLLKACPIDWQKGLVNRPITETRVTDQWHDDFYRSYRMQHLNGDHAEHSICRTCRDWRGTPWNLGYEKVVVTLSGGG